MRLNNSLLLFAAALMALAAHPTQAQSLPSARDTAYLGPITLHVDATDLDHKVLQVRETLPVREGPLTLLYPQWIPGDHGPSNEVKRLAGLHIDAGGKPLNWKRDPANLHAFKVDVPAGISLLELRYQQVLPLEPP